MFAFRKVLSAGLAIFHLEQSFASPTGGVADVYMFAILNKSNSGIKYLGASYTFKTVATIAQSV